MSLNERQKHAVRILKRVRKIIYDGQWPYICVAINVADGFEYSDVAVQLVEQMRLSIKDEYTFDAWIAKRDGKEPSRKQARRERLAFLDNWIAAYEALV